jgi:hypothetical protein
MSSNVAENQWLRERRMHHCVASGEIVAAPGRKTRQMKQRRECKGMKNVQVFSSCWARHVRQVRTFGEDDRRLLGEPWKVEADDDSTRCSSTAKGLSLVPTTMANDSRITSIPRETTTVRPFHLRKVIFNPNTYLIIPRYCSIAAFGI